MFAADEKGQTPKRQAAQRLRIYSSLIRFAIWFGRALSLGTKVTTSDNFRASFKTLIFSQPVFTLFAADNGTNPETSGRTAIESICVHVFMHDKHINKDKRSLRLLCYIILSCYVASVRRQRRDISVFR